MRRIVVFAVLVLAATLGFTGVSSAAPTSPAGRISGCVAVDPALAQDVAQNSADFYVNVHNVAFPAGAIRGQLRG